MSIETTFEKIGEIAATELLWFYFDQNNSGGRFVQDENVGEGVLVQDFSAEKAIERAREFMDNSDSCPCCGDRWSPEYVKDEDGTRDPLIYDKPLSEWKPFHHNGYCVLHHFGGKVTRYPE